MIISKVIGCNFDNVVTKISGNLCHITYGSLAKLSRKISDWDENYEPEVIGSWIQIKAKLETMFPNGEWALRSSQQQKDIYISESWELKANLNDSWLEISFDNSMEVKAFSINISYRHSSGDLSLLEKLAADLGCYIFDGNK